MERSGVRHKNTRLAREIVRTRDPLMTSRTIDPMPVLTQIFTVETGGIPHYHLRRKRTNTTDGSAARIFRSLLLHGKCHWCKLSIIWNWKMEELEMKTTIYRYHHHNHGLIETVI